jgi:hypothetical protein
LDSAFLREPKRRWSLAKTPLVFGKNAVGLWIEAWTLGHFFTAGTKVGYCTPSTLFAGRST